MGRYRKRPLEAEAVQFDGVGVLDPEFEDFLVSHNRSDAPQLWQIDGAGELWIYVEKSSTHCHLERGGWVVAEPDGLGVYPNTAAQFEATYEPV